MSGKTWAEALAELRATPEEQDTAMLRKIAATEEALGARGTSLDQLPNDTAAALLDGMGITPDEFSRLVSTYGNAEPEGDAPEEGAAEADGAKPAEGEAAPDATADAKPAEGEAAPDAKPAEAGTAEIPEAGIDRASFLSNKFGSETRIKRMHDALCDAGKSAMIVFDFDVIKRVPNTVSAHRFIQMANLVEKGSAAAEQVFKSYFTDGSDISDLGVLAAISDEIGLDGDAICGRLESDELADLVYRENARAHRLGINGVPSFACNGSMIISGAQGSKILTRVIDAATAELKIGRTQASFS